MIETRSSLIMRIRDPADSRSWREFTELYGPLVRSLVLAQGVDRQDADDVVQEVFLRLVKAAPAFQLDRQRGKFGTWLWQVVHNAAADHFRQKQRFQQDQQEWQTRIAAAEAAAARSPEPSWLEDQRQRVVASAMQKVRAASEETTWQCFHEHVLKERPAGEVASELGLSRTAVFSNSSRTMARIRAQCADYMEELGDE